MPAQLILGLDIGTTGCKTVAVDAALRICASSAATYPLHSPQAAIAEQDIQEVWRGCAKSLRKLMDQLPAHSAVAGLCLSGAMHSLLPVDPRGQALARAWTWADARSADIAGALRESPLGETLYRNTGCPVQAMYHPARLRWMKHHHRSRWRQRPRWVGLKDAVLHQLTGQWVTDWSIASATGLLNLHTRDWDAQALQLAEIQSTQLPRPVAPATVIGELLPKIAKSLGLPVGLPVIAGGSDGAMANVGAGAVTGGQIVATVGTTGALRRITTAPLLDSQARTWCYVLDHQRYLAGGAINNGGLTLQWIHDRLFADRGGFPSLFKEAAAVGPGAQGLMLLPYFTGERSPHWAPQARAAWIGLSLAHDRGHMARAGMEAVAYCLRDVWELVHQKKDSPVLLRLTGGITQSPLWCRILADVLGVTIAPLEGADASAVGAAMVGHVALQHAPSLASLANRLQLPRTRYRPHPRRHVLYARLHRRFQDHFYIAKSGNPLSFGYIA